MWSSILDPMLVWYKEEIDHANTIIEAQGRRIEALRAEITILREQNHEIHHDNAHIMEENVVQSLRIEALLDLINRLFEDMSRDFREEMRIHVENVNRAHNMELIVPILEDDDMDLFSIEELELFRDLD